MTSEDLNQQSRWDVIVIGTGSGGKIAAQQLAGQGRRVLAVESGRFGGECPYVACVPAKSLLASAHAGLTWLEAVQRRDEITDHRDDRASLASLTDAGVNTVRGRAQLTAAGDDGLTVTLDRGADRESTLTTGVLVLATGSEPTIPPVDGLDSVDYWTSDQVLSAADQPASLVVLGGGAVGCELAQAFALLGSTVELVEVADHLLPTEADWVGQLMADQLRDDGIRDHLGGAPRRVGRSPGTGVDGWLRVDLADGSYVDADRLLIAGGRQPRTQVVGLEHSDVELDEDGTPRIDARCRVLTRKGRPVPGLYVVGDVTGVSTYTHSANYQAGLVAAEIAGRGWDADYRAVPRVVLHATRRLRCGDNPYGRRAARHPHQSCRS